ncbi:hypothetical protein DB42_CZ00010 [Neochlamydia sp. EPS4]|uniref:hypothetical protein n=1 Tax=Neochlamydia sp. EPS4 TaxID=1478175 RepID=UPI0005828E58|nr:hypothetical protein [Neochlamydia sp. EPS4]KIC72504.1 hypothetical protein DB42_CZ00010 [Neochlamydia sp. EPS4]
MSRLLQLELNQNQHYKANLREQEAFKKIPEVIPILNKQFPKQKIEVWFEDEARLGQQSTFANLSFEFFRMQSRGWFLDQKISKKAFLVGGNKLLFLPVC